VIRTAEKPLRERYRRVYGRAELLLAALTNFVRHTMDWYSARQISRNQRQLVAFSFDYIGTELNLSGVYEGDQLNLVFDWIKAAAPALLQGNAIDVGANIGNHSLYFCDYFPQVFSFEITPRTFAVLQLNAQLASNVTCFNVGMSNTVGTVHLSENPRNVGGTRIVSDPENATRSARVATLDSFADRLGDVSLIKIDVEGHELHVLEGAEQTIRRHKPMLLFEQLVADFTNGTSPCIELLKSHGYRLFVTIEDVSRLPFRVRGPRTEMLASLYRVLVGHGLQLRSRTVFEARQYNMIIAVPPGMEAAAQGM
jgi:FkbM family methyltransferase